MFFYQVQPGDSLFLISRQFAYPLDQLRAVNGLKSAHIVPGQALLIPLHVYTVVPGDTLTRIAKKAFVSLE